jgi:PIN domain nuclease of toxin-antitoxin system
MIAGVADTHAALWHLFDDSRLSTSARRFIDEAAASRRKILISSISMAELVYLVEKGRLPQDGYDQLAASLGDPEHVFAEAAFTIAIVQAMRQISRTEIPDMPDRMIAATAVYYEVPILSRDRHIRSANVKTVW